MRPPRWSALPVGLAPPLRGPLRRDGDPGEVFPRIRAYVTSQGSSATPTLNIPTHKAGDLLVAFLANRNTASYSGFPAGWAMLGSAAGVSTSRSEVWGKVADGTETSTTVTQSASGRYVTATLAIKDWAGLWSKIGANQNSNSLDPPAVSNPCGNWPMLPLVMIAWQDSTKSTSVGPTGYSRLVNVAEPASSTTGREMEIWVPTAAATVGGAPGGVTTASENPSAFTNSGASRTIHIVGVPR